MAEHRLTFPASEEDIRKLHAGDLLTFPADVPHVYEGLPEAHYVLLMSYP